MPASNAQSKPPSPDTGAATQWRDAQLAAALIAVLGHRGGGIRVCAQPGPVRDYWLSNLDGTFDATGQTRARNNAYRTPFGWHGCHRKYEAWKARPRYGRAC